MLEEWHFNIIIIILNKTSARNANCALEWISCKTSATWVSEIAYSKVILHEGIEKYCFWLCYDFDLQIMKWYSEFM